MENSRFRFYFWRSPFVRAPAPKLKRGGAFWLRSPLTRCNGCQAAGRKARGTPAPLLVALAVAGVGARSLLAVRWLPWRERFYGNCISCTRSRRTVNALERRHASLKIESQLSIDEELASIERMEYSGRRLMAARARAPAAHLHTIESAEESLRMMRACQSARPMLLLLRDSQGGTGEPSPASASSPSLFAACASLAGARGSRVETPRVAVWGHRNENKNL